MGSQFPGKMSQKAGAPGTDICFAVDAPLLVS